MGEAKALSSSWVRGEKMDLVVAGEAGGGAGGSPAGDGGATEIVADGGGKRC